MGSKTEQAELVAALRGYLEDLQESGVDGLPLAAFPQSHAVPAAEPESLDEIRRGMGECRRCQLGKGGVSLVFGSGNHAARLLFVGEAPEEEAARQGEPFSGESGELLAKIIQAMGFEPDQVYLCHLVKCRPPGGRNPEPDEIEQCQPFLLRQVQAIKPEAIVALGTLAAQILLQTKEPISRLRGSFHDFHGIPLMPTFHPGYLLRNPAMKREVWEDMQQVMKLLGKTPPQGKRD